MQRLAQIARGRSSRVEQLSISEFVLARASVLQTRRVLHLDFTPLLCLHDAHMVSTPHRLQFGVVTKHEIQGDNRGHTTSSIVEYTASRELDFSQDGRLSRSPVQTGFQGGND